MAGRKSSVKFSVVVISFGPFGEKARFSEHGYVFRDEMVILLKGRSFSSEELDVIAREYSEQYELPESMTDEDVVTKLVEKLAEERSNESEGTKASINT